MSYTSSLLIPIIVLCVVIFIGFNYVGEHYADTSLLLGDEVKTSDYYNECFNESFEGRVISSTLYRYTVRDMEGNERTFEKKWLVKIGDE